MALLWPSVGVAQLLNPGPLHRSHSRQSGDSNCSKCHASGKRVEKSLCLGCHTDLKAKIAQGKGLHGRKYRERKCENCHVEHIGKNSRLIRWPGGSKNAFRHQETGWPLAQGHRSVACIKCHNKKNSRGNASFLTAGKKCVSCHEDPHEKRFGTQCNDCHGDADWKAGAVKKFDHKLSLFKLKGKHASVECKECHGKPPRYKGIDFRGCKSCHRDPHEDRFRPKPCESCHVETEWKEIGKFRGKHPGVSLRNGHRRVDCKKCHDRGNTKRPSRGKACVKCHKPIHIANFGRNCKSCHSSIQWVGLADRVGRKNHGKTRFELQGKHRLTKCTDCHPKGLVQKRRYRGIPFKTCKGCHEDPHKNALLAQQKGADCSQCHSLKGFWPTKYGIVEHQNAAFSLLGRHRSTPCVRCHTQKRPRVSFVAKDKRCVACHENPHAKQFEKEMKKEGCKTCHNTGGWERPNIDHTSWPLTGAHETVNCDRCHRPSAADRTRGVGATYRGIPKKCDGCHEDVHLGQFRLESPVRACDFCHKTDRFLIAKFSHKRTARYELTGEHRELKCEKCHQKASLRGGGEAIRYRLGYRKCKDCHANPHSSK